MFSNLSAAMNESNMSYPIMDLKLPFFDYIAHTRALIEERREASPVVLDTNSPFELYPANPIRAGERLKYGALLIHGLLDCPFSLRDIGSYLQAKGILSRAILLPGHGTMPADLLHVSYHDWLQAVRYGVETLRREVEQIYLIGYSTGAVLSVYQALQDAQIAGIIMLAPAVKIKPPVDIAILWHNLLLALGRNKQKQWLYRQLETDYAKYKSIAFHPVNEVNKLTRVITELRQHHSLTVPTFMALSREDETISSAHAIRFFSSLPNEENKLLLYTATNEHYTDSRILTRQSSYPDLNIKNFAHVSIPFSPDNPHYGEEGDYTHASRANTNQYQYGAYNVIEERLSNILYQMGLLKRKWHELTYNPDFYFMAEKIVHFIVGA